MEAKTKLYALTLGAPTAINLCAQGNFTGGPAGSCAEIVVCRGGRTLELLRLPTAPASARLESVHRWDVFGVVRSLQPFRLPSTTRDYIVVGSDSGRLTVLQYSAARGAFETVHSETFGKSGCRRIVPGEYLAADPRGRAIMVAAVEKQKLVYVMNRDANARLTISSPLEAHKGRTVVHSLCGVDVGFDNPIFAAIEREHSDAVSQGAALHPAQTQKVLTFYELDLGLNNVTRKRSEPVSSTANLVLAVPGWKDGPGGVLVCSADFVTWRNQEMVEVSARIPKRKDTPVEREILITAAALHKQRGGAFFFVVQAETGDLFKLSLEVAPGGVTVTRVVMTYLDTVPVASSLVILRTGYLFVAAEVGPHKLYKFQGLGGGADDTDQYWKAEVEGSVHILFQPRPLKNLLLVDELKNLSPIIDMHATTRPREEGVVLYCGCGRGPFSSLRALRHGLHVSSLAITHLPRVPIDVWTVRKNATDVNDGYVVISFGVTTSVLAVGDPIKEVSDTGFLTTAVTKAVSLLGQDSIVQAHAMGLRIISADRKVSDWKPPGSKTVLCACCNERQVALALAGSGGEIFYFEADESGQLSESGHIEMGGEVTAIDMTLCRGGGKFGRFLAVADRESRVRILSLLPDSRLQQLAVQIVPALVASLAFSEVSGAEGSAVLLNVGLVNGMMYRSAVDPVTGELSDTRTRFLGGLPVKLVRTPDPSIMLALSSRGWLCRHKPTVFTITPMWLGLGSAPLFSAAPFSSEQGLNVSGQQQGFVAISNNAMRIISVDTRLADSLEVTAELPLRHTPRRCVVHPPSDTLVVIETDHRALTEVTKKEMEGKTEPSADAAGVQDMETDDAPPAPAVREPPLDERVFGEVPGNAGQWASCIRLVDPSSLQTHDLIELPQNEAAFSTCTCLFRDFDQKEVFLVVGTAKNLVLQPRRCEAGALHVYKVVGTKFELVHKTPVEDVPMAMCAFQGKLVVGVGNLLRIYELGRKKLLRKCEARNIGATIVQLHSVGGERVAVGDIMESFSFVRYIRHENRLVVLADDTVPRWLSAGLLVDYDTVAAADKFGSIALTRLPKEVTDDLQEESAGGASSLSDRPYLSGAPYRTVCVAQYHVGDTVTALQKTSVLIGSSECLLYATILGGIGALVTFDSREDVDFFEHLEMHMRVESPPICGREHMAFRGAYLPVKDVVDGDLCEQYASLDPAKQRSIAKELDMLPADVIKKLENIRHAKVI